MSCFKSKSASQRRDSCAEYLKDCGNTSTVDSCVCVLCPWKNGEMISKNAEIKKWCNV